MKDRNYNLNDFYSFFKLLWDRKRNLAKYIMIFALVGALIGFIMPKEYTVNTIMVPQMGNTEGASLGGLSSLAAMAGFDIGSINSTDVLSPLMYSKILESTPFQLELMNSYFICPNVKQPITLFDYYSNYNVNIFNKISNYTLGLPSLIFKSINSNVSKPQDSSYLRLTEEQELTIKKIKKDVKVELNDKDGFILIISKSNDAYLAAQVALKAQKLLQKYITKYKIEKATEQLNFIKERYLEKKEEFEQAQRKLAIFRDQNKNVITALVKSEEEKLQGEYNIAFSVYSELAKQYEQAQIKVKEDTPILTIIDPVKIPFKKTAPNRMLILFFWSFIGLILGIIIVLKNLFFTSSTITHKDSEMSLNS